jgi:hypothetical protein
MGESAGSHLSLLCGLTTHIKEYQVNIIYINKKKLEMN